MSNSANREVLQSIEAKLKSLIASNYLTSHFRGQIQFEEYDNPSVQDISILSSDMSKDVTLASFGEDEDYALVSNEDNAIELLEEVFELISNFLPNAEIKLITEVQHLAH